MKNIIEVWRPIKINQKYSVSSLGRIKSNNKILKQTMCKNGYLYVSLGRKYKCIVHRLVAENFLENPKREVNHIDGNKLNNNLLNLEWVSSSENKLHLYSNKKGKYIYFDKITNKYRVSRRKPKLLKFDLGRFNSYKEAEKALKNKLCEIY